MVVMLFIAALLIYLIPTGVAVERNHHQRAAIIVLNIFLGWTFIGWVAALVWASTAVQPQAPNP